MSTQSEAKPNAFQATPRIGLPPTAKLTRLSVLVPVYNERMTLRGLMRRVLSLETPLELEVVAVDDGSSDGSWEMLQEIAADDSRLRCIRHEKNQGKGAAVRTAIERMTGDVAVVQDADQEYDPHELPRLLEPILQGKADAVFGSRFAGDTRRVLLFWHSVANQMLTLMSNMAGDLNLTDMETCYKMVRSDVLKNLNLRSNTFTIEPELTARLSQWGARIYEVPISYSGRTYDEGKKIGARDALKAVGAIIRTHWIDTRFTDHAGFYVFTSVSKASRYNRWVLGKVAPYLGERLLEAGAGIGNRSYLLLQRERLVVADYDPLYINRLQRRFGHLDNVRIAQVDFKHAADIDSFQEEEFDSVYCNNVIEHLEDDAQVLKHFHEVLTPGGHCVIGVPANPRLYTGVDAELGHYRRYTKEELCRKMEQAGFEIVHAEQFNKLGTLGWAFSGFVMRRKRLKPGQMIWFDRLLWLARALEYVLPVPGMSLVVVGRKSAE